MKYEEARTQIKNGDILFFIDANESDPIRWFIHWITKKITKSSYVHVGVAVWMHASLESAPRLFLIEAQFSGRRIIPLSNYSDRKFDVIPMPADWSKVEATAIEHVGLVSYGFADYIAIGIYDLFKIRLKDYSGELCSEMAAKLCVDGGYDKLSTTVLAPGDLARELIANGSEITLQVDQL